MRRVMNKTMYKMTNKRKKDSYIKSQKNDSKKVLRRSRSKHKTGDGRGGIKIIYNSNTENKENKHFNHTHQLNCSPNPNNKDYTCYSDNALSKMKHYWNMRHPDDTINTNDSKEIWSHFKRRLSNMCDRESCWLRSKFMEGNIDTELLNYTFAPSAPEKWKRIPNEWLSTLDIEAVMKQYEKFYKCFEFLGPSPIDYNFHTLYGECVWEELCKFNLSEQIKRNKYKIGIIFNTDRHDGNGEHWISMFVNIKTKSIIYFDSNGNPPPKEVKKLIDTINRQGKQIGIDFNVMENKIEHQRSNSECGMYCLYFIIQMLKDDNPEHFLNNRIDDSEVFKLRQKYFNIT